MILYPYVYRYFHLVLKFCLFCLLIQADCQPSDFLFSLWGLQILHFYLNSVPPPSHSNLWILLSILSTIFLIFLSAILKPSTLDFDVSVLGANLKWNESYLYIFSRHLLCLPELNQWLIDLGIYYIFICKHAWDLPLWTDMDQKINAKKAVGIIKVTLLHISHIILQKNLTILQPWCSRGINISPWSLPRKCFFTYGEECYLSLISLFYEHAVLYHHL